jgi:hypothetical protein
MPVLLRLTLEDGSTIEARWPADVWASTRTVTRVVTVPGAVKRVELDPGHLLPDVDRKNDVWETHR